MATNRSMIGLHIFVGKASKPLVLFENLGVRVTKVRKDEGSITLRRNKTSRHIACIDCPFSALTCGDIVLDSQKLNDGILLAHFSFGLSASVSIFKGQPLFSQSVYALQAPDSAFHFVCHKPYEIQLYMESTCIETSFSIVKTMIRSLSRYVLTPTYVFFWYQPMIDLEPLTCRVRRHYS